MPVPSSPDGLDNDWRQHLDADPAILGRELRVDGRQKKIVGVLAPGFRFLSSEARLFLPFASNLEQRTSGQRHSGGGEMVIVARLKPAYSLSDAQAQIDRHNHQVRKGGADEKFAEDAGFRTVVVPLRDDHVAGIRPVLLLTRAGGLLLMMIGAVNLVNLLLIRASGRAKEIAVRRALRASRLHVVIGALNESFVLAGAAGTLGVGFGVIGLKLLMALGADRLPLGVQISPDWRWALAALSGIIVVGVSMALPIVWFSIRRHLASTMQSESRGSTGNRAAQSLRHGFVVAQISLAFVLLTGACLLGLSFQKELATSPGFRSAVVQTARKRDARNCLVIPREDVLSDALDPSGVSGPFGQYTFKPSPTSQDPGPDLAFAIRTKGDPRVAHPR